MKSYKERTQMVEKKLEEYELSKEQKKNKRIMTAQKSKSPIKKYAWLGGLATACCAFVLVFSFVLLPQFNNNQPKNDNEASNGGDVINKPDGGENSSDNVQDYSRLIEVLKSIKSDSDIIDGDDYGEGNAPQDDNAYLETTNNQVESVTEGDLLKCSTNYAFYLKTNIYGYVLNVYGLNGKELPLVASYTVTFGNGMRYTFGEEMYLSSDCNTVTVISSVYNNNVDRAYTCLTSLDVSDVDNIREVSLKLISGEYISSRYVGGELLVFTNFEANVSNFLDEADFLPQIGTQNNLKSLPAKNIIFPQRANSPRYTVVCSFSQADLKLNSSYAFLSYSNNVYVSKESIYLTRSYTNLIVDERHYGYERFTDITRIAYGDGSLGYKATATVKGFVNNQYSMDEYDGVLRVVVEVQRVIYDVIDLKKSDIVISASLYCVDLDNFAVCASYEEFSPNGEAVMSVRFDGTTAYVCTATALLDPVFAIDLSDLNDIKSKDTGTISGYSHSLIKFKDDALLGIGLGDNFAMLKIELYREMQDGVESVAVYTMHGNFPWDFKSYYIDAQRGLIGLSISYWDADERQGVSEYILLQFDGESLSVVKSVTLSDGSDPDCSRAMYLDGYVYVFTNVGAYALEFDN